MSAFVIEECVYYEGCEVLAVALTAENAETARVGFEQASTCDLVRVREVPLV